MNKKVEYFFIDLGRICKEIPRYILHIIQKLTRGFSDSDLWSLDVAISKFTIKRLKAFRDKKKIFQPNIIDLHQKRTWDEIIDDMIFYHQVIIDFELSEIYSKRKSNKSDYDRFRRGKYYFYKYYECLMSRGISL